MVVNVSDAISRALTRRAAGTGHGVTPRSLAELERRAGSRSAAARLAGVSPETFRRWVNGTQKPSKRHRAGLEAAVRRSRLRPGRETRLRSSRPRMVVTGNVRVSSDVRQRTIDLGPFVEAGFMDQLLDAYLDGDEDRQAQLMSDAMDSYVPDMEIDITSLHIGAAGPRSDDSDDE